MKGEKSMKLEKKIKELRKIVQVLSQLALEIGSLISVIKMIIDSL